jgi:hypothetical protein
MDRIYFSALEQICYCSSRGRPSSGSRLKIAWREKANGLVHVGSGFRNSSVLVKWDHALARRDVESL